MALAYKYRLIDQDYKLAVLNKILVMLNINQMVLAQLCGNSMLEIQKAFLFGEKVCMKYPESRKRLIIDCIHYVSSSILAKNTHYLKESPRKCLTILLSPIGLCLAIYTKYKTR